MRPRPTYDILLQMLSVQRQRLNRESAPIEFTGEEVQWGEWSVGMEPMQTHNAFTCIVMAALNNETRQGVLAHMLLVPPYPIPPQTAAAGALAAVAGLGEVSQTEVWLGGGSLGPAGDPGYEFVLPGRDSLRRSVEEMGAYLLASQWSDPGEFISVGFNPKEALIQITARSLRDHAPAEVVSAA